MHLAMEKQSGDGMSCNKSKIRRKSCDAKVTLALYNSPKQFRWVIPHYAKIVLAQHSYKSQVDTLRGLLHA